MYIFILIYCIPVYYTHIHTHKRGGKPLNVNFSRLTLATSLTKSNLLKFTNSSSIIVKIIT